MEKSGSAIQIVLSSGWTAANTSPEAECLVKRDRNGKMTGIDPPLAARSRE